MVTNIDDVVDEKYYAEQLTKLDDSNFRDGTIIVKTPGEEMIEAHYNLLNSVISKKGYNINAVLPSYNPTLNLTELHINVIRGIANA